MAIGSLPANCIELCCLLSSQISGKISERSKKPIFHNSVKLVCLISGCGLTMYPWAVLVYSMYIFDPTGPFFFTRVAQVQAM